MALNAKDIVGQEIPSFEIDLVRGVIDIVCGEL
jgi:hypothetical protein